MGDEKKDELAGTTALTVPSAQSGSILQQELGPVKPEEVDAYVKVRESSERLSRLKTFITSWEKQQEEERSLRRSYAQYLIIILAVELLLMFAAFFGIGLEWLKVDKWIAETFVVAAFSQTSAMVLIVVKYLFPAKDHDLLRLALETADSAVVTTSPKKLPAAKPKKEISGKPQRTNKKQPDTE